MSASSLATTVNLEENTPKTANTDTMSSVDKHRKTYGTLKWPLVMYGLLGGLYTATLPGKWVWFSWHPLFMVISFVTLAGNATLLKKIGGYENTKLHGTLMGLAITSAAFAWYVIYSNKEMAGKAHLTSIHGKLGAAVMAGYIGLGIFGAVAFHPDFGIMKTHKLFRAVHKWAGRLFTAGAWVCCVLGFTTMQSELWKQVVFTLPLVVAGVFVLV